MSWCHQLQQSIYEDSVWTPTILFPSSLSSKINNIITQENSTKGDDISYDINPSPSQDYDLEQHVNIVNLLNPQDISLLSCMKSISCEHNYPTNAVFYFEGYDGFCNKYKLCEVIKEAAFKFGTVLNIEKTYNVNNRNKFYYYTLACSHFGKPSKSTSDSKTFLPGCMQAQNTIIQVSHSSSSIKNRSRNATMQRACYNANNAKLNRSNTIKCGCSFQLSIMFEHVSNRWFMKHRRQSKTNPLVCNHTNHIWIDPTHLYVFKKNLSDHVRNSITSLIDTGSPISNIVLSIYANYKVNVSWQTIYNIRNKKISDLLDKCAVNPCGSSVDRLIEMFKRQTNVSFVYVMHRYNSGFVTYRKSKNNKSVQTDTSMQNKNLSKDSVNDWRDSLKLSETNDILVSFAWAHDDELKAAEMYPEFLAADITYGVNKEKRDLFLVVGIDGYNKVFTAFRCFIPSKQEHAYTWILNEAMPRLISNNVLKFNQCISSDQEFALNRSIETSIDSRKESFKHSKLRLDCFHFFTLRWLSTVTKACKSNEYSSQILSTIYKWILSWFRHIETKTELDISHHYLIKYFESKHQFLGVQCVFEINKLINNIISKKKVLLHPYFKHATTFDFIGDSIVESANAPIKKGPIKVSNSMEISNSGITQLKATEATFHKKKLKSAKKINSTKTWSISLTSDFLTDYAEGLAIANFDRRKEYTKIRLSKQTWHVVHSSLFKNDYPCSFSKRTNATTKFVRVREVTVNNDNFMNCTCGYVHRWLMPCVHICSVLEHHDYYTPSLFHLRWWKMFHYLYKSKSNSNKIKSTTLNLKHSLDYIRENHYNENNGLYKGVPIHDSPFLLNPMSNFHTESLVDENETTRIIASIWKMQCEDKPLIKGSMLYEKFISSSQHINNEGIDYMDIDNQDNIFFLLDNEEIEATNMGAGSQVESNLSQHRLEMNSSTTEEDVVPQESSSSVHSINAYSDLQPIFNDMIQQIKTKSQLDKAVSCLQKLNFEFKADSMKSRIINETETLMLGEVNGSRRQEIRHKFLYERHRK